MCRPGYVELAIDKAAIKSTIFEHPEFAAFIESMNAHFETWRTRSAKTLKALEAGCNPKEVIYDLSEDLLAHYTDKPLINKYDVYQHLMDYWVEVMQDDCYAISADGWKAKTCRIIEKDRKGRQKDKGWACDLIPKELIVARYFAEEQAEIDELATAIEIARDRTVELEEEHGDEDGIFSDFDKVNKSNVTPRLKEIKGDKDAAEEAAVLKEWLKLSEDEAEFKRDLKEAEAELDEAVYDHYPKLTEAEIKALVVDDKWLATLDDAVHGEMDRISQALADRIRTLAERYEFSMPELASPHPGPPPWCGGGTPIRSASWRPWGEVPALIGSAPPATPPSTGTGVVTFLMG